MKSLTTLILLSIGIIGNSQIIKDTSYFDGCNWTTCKGGACQTTTVWCGTIEGFDDKDIRDEEWKDTLIASRLIADSLGRTYEIEYRYTGERQSGEFIVDSNNTSFEHHNHYIALVTIISFKGNKRKIIAENIKSIYSPVDCSADCPALWLKRLYQILNKK